MRRLLSLFLAAFFMFSGTFVALTAHEVSIARPAAAECDTSPVGLPGPLDDLCETVETTIDVGTESTKTTIDEKLDPAKQFLDMLCSQKPTSIICDALEKAVELAGDVLSGELAVNLMRNFTDGMAEMMASMLEDIWALVTATTDPRVALSLTAESIYGKMLGLAAVLVLPLALIATIQQLFKGSSSGVARVWLVYVPFAVVGGFMAIAVTDILLRVATEMELFIGKDFDTDFRAFLEAMMGAVMSPKTQATGGEAGNVTVFLDAPWAAFAALIIQQVFMWIALWVMVVLWIEMMFRTIIIVSTAFFLPLAFAGLVWEPSQKWLSRAIKLLLAAIFFRFILVALLSLGVAIFNAMLEANGSSFSSFASNAASGTGEVGLAASWTVWILSLTVLLLGAFTPAIAFRAFDIFESGIENVRNGRAQSRYQPATRVTQPLSPGVSGSSLYANFRPLVNALKEGDTSSTPMSGDPGGGGDKKGLPAGGDTTGGGDTGGGDAAAATGTDTPPSSTDPPGITKKTPPPGDSGGGSFKPGGGSSMPDPPEMTNHFGG